MQRIDDEYTAVQFHHEVPVRVEFHNVRAKVERRSHLNGWDVIAACEPCIVSKLAEDT